MFALGRFGWYRLVVAAVFLVSYYYYGAIGLLTATVIMLLIENDSHRLRLEKLEEDD